MSDIVLVDICEVVTVPADVAVCPECSSPLGVQVMSWGDDGEPHDLGVDCDNEELCAGCGHDADDHRSDSNDTCHGEFSCFCSSFEDSHHGRQSDWQTVIDRVEAWARPRLRVKP